MVSLKIWRHHPLETDLDSFHSEVHFFCEVFFLNSLREVLLAFSSFSIALNLLRAFLIFVQSYLNTLGYHCYELNV